MSIFLYIILSTFLITLCVWVAVFLLALKKDTLQRISIFLVSLSAGSFLGGAFLHLLPEAAEKIEGERLYMIVLCSFIFFFFMEKLLHWRHCHKENCSIHTFGYINLLGDSVHNFIDGLVIASAFMIDIRLGFVTTFAIALHEIPQEIGDFGVLIHAGFDRVKALVINYLVALAVVLGGVVGFFVSSSVESIIPGLLPFAAGGFIYIAASDLMPEIKKEPDFKRSVKSFLIFLLGVLLMYAAKFIE
ncbi:MAG: Zinc/iron permease [Candidatus Falkowbacteria bacterium GW2011_GWC2_38_22]|uniref:Zinc/iron permease n=1 Tax=Candidatus Falkowbacteria bacterium GW2011_GWE1_38_31 TaxID=1618638 RepID=A0A0G0JV99_9BACT|nr:MAG: Zinc/iron permease [Candidatus Falkowbacteria bacterium GW2011_GWF2_38_1205]KKQ61706.1 MAG: Zinc/iron permease [Candidatus Falkowbacteria bacterium GW2011_GWC2_38_22]KKQ63679.1 MAG: Zinc/iron permease [Candidatus Falkowbacteria bacterium GW2011_GWF1_38_22]KKQ65905.1 MAG: Zinc/iron permease [Candidatus Falkowbacteria bacterium GW2011_GWE2_38_254]KKQ70542.1 MAG: Zinc/iron permease [Candidatus Falkowbacteria bacterium GW2011_GWE1_38_31]KKQ72938.1 MAG: Zinc/iron permease [Candidatus Falkow